MGKQEAPASASKAAAPPAATKSSDVEMLANCMDKMKVSEQQSWGFNFNCPHPHYWWSYTINGSRYLKFEFLVHTCPVEDLSPKMSKDGNYLYLSNKIPDRFLDLGRLLFQYDPSTLPRRSDGSCTEAMYQQGVAATTQIKELNEMEAIKPTTKIKLPYTCMQSFTDPFDTSSDGTALGVWPHEKDPNHTVYIYSVSLKDAAAPRSEVKSKFKIFDIKPPPTSGGSGTKRNASDLNNMNTTTNTP